MTRSILRRLDYLYVFSDGLGILLGQVDFPKRKKKENRTENANILCREEWKKVTYVCGFGRYALLLTRLE